ncbi:sulfotransferase family 2 domain-containing protein [Bauldia sp.]|uniref:sulfotransferase family 2 domain-containing protein n=1 Tax=Bauldia sp. TaxID=2575872 RepID=UPI003BA8742C
MIVSHKHKFIFIHLGRTGGRSLTAALAKACGPKDIVTRAKGAERNHTGYWRHTKAIEVRDRIGRDRYEEYFKFTIERNPWDKIISRYWSYVGQNRKPLYKKIPEYVTGKPLSFRTWFELRLLQGRTIGFGHYKFPRHYDCYTDDGEIIVDFIGRHENLDEHTAEIFDRLKLKVDVTKRYGTKRHKERRSYTDLFDQRMNEVVETHFEKDLALLGYRFGEPPPLAAIEPGRQPQTG